jgi:hypothetical protein
MGDPGCRQGGDALPSLSRRDRLWQNSDAWRSEKAASCPYVGSEIIAFAPRPIRYKLVARYPRTLTAGPASGRVATGGWAVCAASSLISRSASAAMLSGDWITSRSSAQW